MSRRNSHKSIVGAELLETRNLMSALPVSGACVSAEVRVIVINPAAARHCNPQPDPPGSDRVGPKDIHDGGAHLPTTSGGVWPKQLRVRRTRDPVAQSDVIAESTSADYFVSAEFRMPSGNSSPVIEMAHSLIETATQFQAGLSQSVTKPALEDDPDGAFNDLSEIERVNDWPRTEESSRVLFVLSKLAGPDDQVRVKPWLGAVRPHAVLSLGLARRVIAGVRPATEGMSSIVLGEEGISGYSASHLYLLGVTGLEPEGRGITVTGTLQTRTADEAVVVLCANCGVVQPY
jgi:hypothetical protein